MSRRVWLVGAGGHAKVVKDALSELGWSVAAYVDPKQAGWLDAKHYANDDAALQEQPQDGVAIGIGGMNPAWLETRYETMKRYVGRGHAAPVIADPRAIVSKSAQIADGTQIIAGGIVNANARVGRLVIVNTRAVVEHDAVVGDGTHVAPGAIILGGAAVGDFCMVGSGAIVLPGARVPDRTLISAGVVYSERDKSAAGHAMRGGR